MTKDGAEQIAETDLAQWKLNGGFMSAGGDIIFPVQLLVEEAEAIAKLLARGQNFVWWFTSDFRTIFVTRDGVIDSAGKWWKVRFEWRGVDRQGKPASNIAHFGKKVRPDVILPAIENLFANFVVNLEADAAKRAAPGGPSVTESGVKEVNGG